VMRLLEYPLWRLNRERVCVGPGIPSFQEALSD
jgi:hypothetical protein